MNSLIKQIEQSIIGSNSIIETPFGCKPLIYADYTASGRGLSFIEDYIKQNVLPFYANTHTDTSYTGAQSTLLREEARSIIKNAVGANSRDKLIFCGSGATAAINKLIDIMGLRLPHKLNEKYKFVPAIPETDRPVVFIGPYEHHSNEIPWRESLADVINIPLGEDGQIDIQFLKQELIKYQGRLVKIGSFSAASNVTGICSDIAGITKLLKSYGALSFWDYAAAAPYMPIHMNAASPIDAVFISPHKFIGGPSTPGVLIVKENILNNSVPTIVGGGTVAYVTPDHHKFIKDPERREEGGTPAIVESIRAGLVFKLQQQVGVDTIKSEEQRLVRKALAFFKSIPEIEVLGTETHTERLSIFSLRFKHLGQDLHYGYIAALLNDLFGIQVRGGCSCAGPYGHFLLGMSKEYSQQIEAEILKGTLALRPGWVRMNFNYFISNEELNYILQAIKLVAKYGWRLLPFYHLDKSTAVWRYQGEPPILASSLNKLSFSDTCITHQEHPKPDFSKLLHIATDILKDTNHKCVKYDLNLSENAEALRWFVLPQQCAEVLSAEKPQINRDEELQDEIRDYS